MLTLERYHGSRSRHTCPACGRKKKFTRYIDTENGRYLADHVGRCDRESACGYHYKPKQFLADNPQLQERTVWRSENLRKPKIGILQSQGSIVTNGLAHQSEGRFRMKKPDYIEPAELTRTLTDYARNSFVQFLLGLFPFDPEDVWQAVNDYAIGTHATGRTIFWQIDRNRRIRTGKAFAYSPDTGKREKTKPPFFLHPRTGFELQQCFFGEHLLQSKPGFPIAIVESEKSAVIGSICKSVFPDMVWLACGGKSNLSIERLMRFRRGRTIVLYPDADGFEKWQGIASDASRGGCHIMVSNLLERQATETEKANKVDLADYLIREQRKRNDPVRRSLFSDLVEERLAILTFDGGLSLTDAEDYLETSGFILNAEQQLNM